MPLVGMGLRRFIHESSGVGAINGLKDGLRDRGVGVAYHLTLNGQKGTILGRLDDLDGVPLIPTLDPDRFYQTFVTGPVLKRGERVITAERAMIERFQPVIEEPIKWNELRFALNASDVMFFATVRREGDWKSQSVQDCLHPFSEFPINPAAVVLNYGQGGFEGMKAFRTEKGQIVLFRPLDNARRFRRTAARMLMTPVPEDYYLEAVKRVVLANERLIPPAGKSAMYVRPLQIGIGPALGVQPAPEEAFIIYVSPVGPYFGGGLVTIKLLVEEEFHRSAPGITGDVKAIGNYAGSLLPGKRAKKAGFAEIIYLDTQFNSNVEEVGAANFFCVKEGVIYTPVLSGSILPGITRDSVIKIARALGYNVEEVPLSIGFVMQADEAFCAGAAAVISPIGSITWKGWTVVFNNREVGPVSKGLYELLTAIQEQRAPDPHGWVHVIK